MGHVVGGIARNCCGMGSGPPTEEPRFIEPRPFVFQSCRPYLRFAPMWDQPGAHTAAPAVGEVATERPRRGSSEVGNGTMACRGGQVSRQAGDQLDVAHSRG